MFFDAKYDPGYYTDTLKEEIENFWDYFEENEYDLVNALYSNDKAFLDDFEKRINKVFYLSKKMIPYAFSFKDGRYQFIIFFGRSSYILSVANMLFDYPDKDLDLDWSFVLQKSRKYHLFDGKK